MPPFTVFPALLLLYHQGFPEDDAKRLSMAERNSSRSNGFFTSLVVIDCFQQGLLRQKSEPAYCSRTAKPFLLLPSIEGDAREVSVQHFAYRCTSFSIFSSRDQVLEDCQALMDELAKH